jgi:hypothetical protein
MDLSDIQQVEAFGAPRPRLQSGEALRARQNFGAPFC